MATEPENWGQLETWDEEKDVDWVERMFFTLLFFGMVTGGAVALLAELVIHPRKRKPTDVHPD